MRLPPMLAALVAASLAFTGSLPAHATSNGKTVYDAQILRTSYGIPHIQATDWGSLGYGYGYAFAEDNLCVLARDVLAATGTLSRHFGPGSGNANLISDWAYKLINSDSRVDPAWNTLDADTLALLQGYADPDLQAAVALACRRVNEAQIELVSGHRLRMELAPEVLDW